MNKYIIRIDEACNIIYTAYTFDYLKTDIELTEEEYALALTHKKFDPKVRVFTEPVKTEEVKETEHDKLTKETHETTSLSAEDNVVNMDLIMSLDDKVSAIMEHLGL